MACILKVFNRQAENTFFDYGMSFINYTMQRLSQGLAKRGDIRPSQKRKTEKKKKLTLVLRNRE
jgi:predicted peptidase